MKACTLWEKETTGHIDEVKLEPLVQTAKQFDVNNVSKKVIIDAVFPTPAYPNDSKNVGLRKRHQNIVLLDRLHLDLFQQEACLPNGVDICRRFSRGRPQFYMRKVKPTPTIVNLANQQLSTQTAKYPPRRVEVKTFTLPTGTQSKINDHLFQ
jgi:hypothetical protein